MKDKYDGATEVRVNKRGRLQIRDPRYNMPTANDLVYLAESPNYCVRNLSLGSLESDGARALRLQVPLVLPRRVQDLCADAGPAHVQVDTCSHVYIVSSAVLPAIESCQRDKSVQ
ncbi:hypothetical protein B566_EDAN007510 [Ephemera danica]|nr:hypothetical protein B566_EDAN007510 [Ephemera danica]